MAWSTQELADLAGTTVNTVRYYHRSGLLEQPDRMSNGYKQYSGRHLVRILHIRRLRDLGVPLDKIDELGDSGGASEDTLREADAELTKSIERLTQARSEVRAILAASSGTGVPPGFETLSRKLSVSERGLMLVYAQLYDEEALADVRRMLEAEPDDAAVAFDALDPDSDESTRQELAEAYAVVLARDFAKYPWLRDPGKHLSKSPQITEAAFIESVAALFTPAQLDVLSRASAIAMAPEAERDTAAPSDS